MLKKIALPGGIAALVFAMLLTASAGAQTNAPSTQAVGGSRGGGARGSIRAIRFLTFCPPRSRFRMCCTGFSISPTRRCPRAPSTALPARKSPISPSPIPMPWSIAATAGNTSRSLTPWASSTRGMLLSSEATGDPKFAAFTARHMQFIHDALPFFRAMGGPPATAPAPGGARRRRRRIWRRRV